MKKLTLYFALAFLCLLCTSAKASVTYSFYGIITEDSNPADIAIGEAQMFVDVEDIGSDQVLFTFRNTGPESSSITDVYFYDGSLLGISSLWDADEGYPGSEDWGHSGVDFDRGANPDHLPGLGGGTKLTDAFCADSDTPIPQNGVNPDEWLGVIFDLQPQRTFLHLVGELNSGDVLVGIHVQDFDGGGSESFVNNGVIPAPGALILAGIGAGLIGWMRKREIL